MTITMTTTNDGVTACSDQLPSNASGYQGDSSKGLEFNVIKSNCNREDVWIYLQLQLWFCEFGGFGAIFCNFSANYSFAQL